MNAVIQIFPDSEQPSVVVDGAQFIDLRGLSETALLSIRVSVESMYFDNMWNFRKEIGTHASRDYRINFDKILMLDGSPLTTDENLKYLAIFKQFIYTLISNPPPSRPKLTTIIKYLGHGPVLLLRFMHGQRIQSFEDVTKADMGRFLEWCAALPNQNISTVEISSSTLETRVSGLWWVYEQRSKMDRGLSLAPWDGLSAKEWASQAASKQSHGRTQEMPDEIAQALVMKAMDIIKLAHTHRQAATAYAKHRKTRQAHPFDWTGFGFSSHFEWHAFPSHVTIAGYILIAMFSGMRVDEIVSLQLEYDNGKGKGKLPCKFVEDIEVDGLVRRCFFVRGFTKKLEDEPRLTRWQVAPIVHDAIDAIIAIRAHYRRGGITYLFASRSEKSVTQRMFEGSINDGLRKFTLRNAINWNGSDWPLASHQFRKKFARMMVRQGLGLRDIQDQLKHIDIEMTKRYGHMDLFHELQMERFSLSNEKYGELLRGSTPIIGGGAQLIESLRYEFIGKTRESQESFLESLSKAALIDAVDFGLCTFNSQRAKCGGNRQNCKPADCLNSVIPLDTAIRHLQNRRVRNAELLQVVKSPLTRAHIVAQQDTTERLLAQAASKDVITTADLKAIASTGNKGTP